ncbi:MAG: ABC transporter permease [Prevotella sp.]|jgi:putative ABC transport system permease protein|nr:ABC transporter permease [Prevotella sp.]
MYKTYFKQAIAMLKQNKFTSFITISGTALAIMMIMVIIVSQSIKNTDIYPENNRDRTLYIKWQKKERIDKTNFRNRDVGYDTYKEYLSNLQTPELVTAICNEREYSIASTETHPIRLSLNNKFVDAAYWQFMSFSFIDGKPFTKEDFDSGLKKAVITESTARQLFRNTDNVVGKTIQVNFRPFAVSGIIKDVSPVFEYAFADIYLPFTTVKDYRHNGYTVLLLAKDKTDYQAIDEEIRLAERKYNATDSGWTLSLSGPYDHKAQQMNKSADIPDIKKNNRRMAFILIVLFLIPAINLSSFSISRIKKRTEEIGIRKSFGAKKYTILIQVLYENLITTLIGGIMGLALSYYAVLELRNWLLGIEAGSAIPLETLVSPNIFAGVFIACLILNLLSAGIPAYKASRMKIVESLNRKSE